MRDIISSANEPCRIPDCYLEIVKKADHRFSRAQDFEFMLQKILSFIVKFKKM